MYLIGSAEVPTFINLNLINLFHEHPIYSMNRTNLFNSCENLHSA